VVRECVYDNLRSVVARREREVVHWNPRFLHLRGHYAFHATACTPQTPREKGSVEGSVRHLKTGFWPARRIASLADLDEQYRDWRDSVCNVRVHSSGRFPVAERLAVEPAAPEPLVSRGHFYEERNSLSWPRGRPRSRRSGQRRGRPAAHRARSAARLAQR
jgi:hypothetical protein